MQIWKNHDKKNQNSQRDLMKFNVKGEIFSFSTISIFSFSFNLQFITFFPFLFFFSFSTPNLWFLHDLGESFMDAIFISFLVFSSYDILIFLFPKWKFYFHA